MTNPEKLSVEELAAALEENGFGDPPNVGDHNLLREAAKRLRKLDRDIQLAIECIRELTLTDGEKEG